MEQKIYNEYVEILKEELLPAMGCTEPIAVAYAAAVAVQALGEKPESVEVNVSANIIKNVKSVVVPCTGGLRGIGAAVCAGIVAVFPVHLHKYPPMHFPPSASAVHPVSGLILYRKQASRSQPEVVRQVI